MNARAWRLAVCFTLIPCLVAPHARANELGASGAASGLVLHDADETLRDYCSTDSDGRLWLEVPGGMRFELITSTSDPAIGNPGDGAFHPFDVAEVRGALAGVRYPLGAIRADVFILPYPRRGGLESAAGPQLLLLSPGVRPLARDHQHAEFVHELGHVVQYQLMPDSDARGWTAYRRVRGLEDAVRYAASSTHADRPHEIFAEDFRALFGGALANYSGSIENAALAAPASVTGLQPFLRSLADATTATAALRATPNPTRGPLRFTRAAETTAPLDLFDLSGRRVASIPAFAHAGATEWMWDGRDLAGRTPGPGVLFARVREANASTVRVTRVP